ncbi:hypothetical protein LOTGIDRAFT_161855 [Lottia gigantea]|uniref:Protein sleepless n=1 Tax=Lottia gigantea TaxID=225164 RepID=V4BW46_LOTGI|nr:hypothetical protein LOTGIDRAFT_161855 [Lottia gigantea]ESO93289.1 hypothetical protein LOTGIDRAFT_161855 [Lottia gigantea]
MALLHQILVMMVIPAFVNGLRCSVCDSVTFAECETAPPDGKECWDPGSGVPKTCIIIRELDQNGKLVVFRRDCSTTKANKCHDVPETGHKACSEVCFTDNCNASNKAASSIHIIFISFIIGITCIFVSLV